MEVVDRGNYLRIHGPGSPEMCGDLPGFGILSALYLNKDGVWGFDIDHDDIKEVMRKTKLVLNIHFSNKKD